LKEFQQKASEHPELFKYFFNENEIQSIEVPEIDDSHNNIYYHWEKVALRLINNISKSNSAWIFREPVDPEKL